VGETENSPIPPETWITRSSLAFQSEAIRTGTRDGLGGARGQGVEEAVVAEGQGAVVGRAERNRTGAPSKWVTWVGGAPGQGHPVDVERPAGLAQVVDVVPASNEDRAPILGPWPR
jgi:hypothetical protein